MPKTFNRVGTSILIFITMKKVQLNNRQALIANILTKKALAPTGGTVHCGGGGHCRVGL